jgi:hypothetical protein
MVILLFNLKVTVDEKALATHLDRSVDLQSRQTTEKARLGMYVRLAIVTGNLSLSILKKHAEIEQEFVTVTRQPASRSTAPALRH